MNGSLVADPPKTPDIDLPNRPHIDSPKTPDTNTEMDFHTLPDNEPQFAPRAAVAHSNGAEVPIRTYRGRTVEELIPRIQAELGADAIILGRREGLTGGLAGFFQHSFIEIEAIAGGARVDVYDEDHAVSSPPPAQAQTREPQPTRMPFYVREPQSRLSGGYVSEQLAALAEAGPLEPAVSRVSRTPGFHEHEPAALSDPFAVVLEQATSAASTPPSMQAGGAPEGTGPVAFPNERAPEYLPGGSRAQEHTDRPPSRRPGPRRPASPSRGRAGASIQAQLSALGVGEQFAGELIDAAAAHILPLAPHAGLAQAVRSGLIQRIPTAPPLPTRGAAITLVGPGGAGKTSCAAALLGAYRKSSPLLASCATLLRGAERGELRMLLSPHVMRPVSIDGARAIRALRRTRGEGLLVIDTPPLSPGDRSGIRKLAALLGELKPERVVVVLPATLGAVAAEQLLQALRPLGANALAVTHADETNQIGVAIEAACKFGLAPEYTLDRGRSSGWRLSRIDPTGLAAKLLT